MASSPKMNYPFVQNYITKFSWSNEPSYLILVYDINNHFHFVDLKKGNILTTYFLTIEDADKWLHEVSEVILKNGMKTTYVP